MTKKRTSPTLREIAEAVGVDKSTVSLVLSGKARKVRISPAREAQIIEVARQLHFRPNSAARATRSGAFDSVALLMSTSGSYSTMSPRTQCTIHDELAAHDISMLLTRLPDEKLTDEGLVPKILRQVCVDGLLINYTDHIPAKMINIIRDNRIPSVWINSKQDGDCIFPDDLSAALAATQRLIAEGHRNIAFLNFGHAATTFDSAHYSAHDRQNGYLAAMSAAGLAPRILREHDSLRTPQIRPYLTALLRSNSPPTAILTYGDTEMLAVFVVAKELQINVHDDLRLMTFADTLLQIADTTIPTYITPQYPLAKQAVEMLLRKIAEPATVLPPQAVAFSYAESFEEFLHAETPHN